MINKFSQEIYPLFDLIKNGIMVTDSKLKIIYINPAYTNTTGYSAQDILGDSPGVLHSGYHDKAFYVAMWESITKNGFWEGEIWNRKKSGVIYPEWLTISALKNIGHDAVYYVGIFSEISVLRSEEYKNINLAHHDPLTNLENRTALEEGFIRNVKRIQRQYFQSNTDGKNKEKMAVIFFDLNKFKQVNDQHGHIAGDKLLKGIARNLETISRPTDIISRFGGDEFVILLSEIDDTAEVEKYCNRIHKIFKKPYEIEGVLLKSSASIGYSIYPDDSRDFEELIKIADQKMYSAKEQWHKMN